MSIYPAGTRVLIVEDVREGHPATSQIGTYEGDFPLTVVLNDGDAWHPGEFDYASYADGSFKTTTGKACKDLWPEWKPGTPKPTGPFAMPMDNPRIRLDDGSVIWGCECWWEPAENDPALPEAQDNLEDFKVVLRGLHDAIHEEMEKKP